MSKFVTERLIQILQQFFRENSLTPLLHGDDADEMKQDQTLNNSEYLSCKINAAPPILPSRADTTHAVWQSAAVC